MEWLDALRRLDDEGAACVLVTLTAVRGHAPRAAGAKMVVSRDGAWDTVGGGNLEATLADRARRMLEDGESEPCSVTIPLNEHARTRYGRQCCGGEVTAFLEPLRATPVVAVFGAGHVGLELARALHRLPVAVELVDSRAAAVEAVRALGALEGPARIRGHHAPAPEAFLRELPAGSHVRIMTHDHAEDLVLCDAALRREDLGSIGLIGSSAKWARFRRMLREQGHDDAAIARIACPIGLPGVTGKAPAVIALSVAAELAEAVRAPRVSPATPSIRATPEVQTSPGARETPEVRPSPGARETPEARAPRREASRGPGAG